MSYAGEATFACLLAFLVAAAFWFLDSRMRRRSYRSANTREWRNELLSDPTVGEAVISHSKNAVKPAWFDGCQEVVDRMNERSGTHQQLYRSSVAAIVGLLLISALATATSSILMPANKSFKVFAAVFDVAGLLLAIALFFVARIAIREFSARRGITELARAWMHAAIVFRIGDGDPASELSSYIGSASKEVDDIPYLMRWRHSGVDYLVVQRWRTLLDDLRKTRTREDKSHGFFSFYILERPVAQLLYMRKARSRMEGSAHSREWLVLLLYLFTLTIAVVKV